MKILTVSRNRLEIARAHLRRPTLTVGRSPSCDVLLRAPGIQAIHFLVEWIGAGAFDPAQGSWSITDISTSEGMVLSSAPVQIGDLTFTCGEDRLEAKEEIGGRIVESFGESLSARTGSAELLEVVQVRSDSGAIEEIRHVIIPKRKTARPRPVEGIRRELKLQWNGQDSGALARIVLQEMPGAQLYSRGEKLDSRSDFELRPNDLVRVHWKGRDIYLRFVEEAKSPPVSHEVIGEPLLRQITLGVISLGAILLALLRFIPSSPAPVETPPPRIARVEVAVTPPPPASIPQPPPVEEAKPAEAKPVPEAKKASQEKSLVPSSKKATKPAQAAKARFKSPDGPSKPGLNSPAAVTDVNAIGILGALSKVNSAKGPGVQAEKVINDGIVRQTENAPNAKVILPNPPSGTLGLGDGGSPKGTKAAGTDLRSASTTLTGAGQYDPNSVGPIARKGGGTGFNIGSGTEGGGTGVGSGSSVGSLGAGEFSVEGGGLDRETVRRVIASYRGEIRTCYERALLAKSSLEGRTVYDWQISPPGAVTRVEITKSTLNSANLNHCVQEVIRKMAFPASTNGKPTRVIYPFVFQGKK